MSKVKIYEKAPLIGPEALAHRSGIHQDGAIKTKDMYFGAYRPIHPSLIGRYDDEKIASICANQKSPEEFRSACQVEIDKIEYAALQNPHHACCNNHKTRFVECSPRLMALEKPAPLLSLCHSSRCRDTTNEVRCNEA